MELYRPRNGPLLTARRSKHHYAKPSKGTLPPLRAWPVPKRVLRSPMHKRPGPIRRVKSSWSPLKDPAATVVSKRNKICSHLQLALWMRPDRKSTANWNWRALTYSNTHSRHLALRLRIGSACHLGRLTSRQQPLPRLGRMASQRHYWRSVQMVIGHHRLPRRFSVAQRVDLYRRSISLSLKRPSQSRATSRRS